MMELGRALLLSAKSRPVQNAFDPLPVKIRTRVDSGSAFGNSRSDSAIASEKALPRVGRSSVASTTWSATSVSDISGREGRVLNARHASGRAVIMPRRIARVGHRSMFYRARGLDVDFAAASSTFTKSFVYKVPGTSGPGPSHFADVQGFAIGTD